MASMHGQLWLITGTGAQVPIANSTALAALLLQLAGDQGLRAAGGVDLEPLLSTMAAPADDPEWLRAEEMLDEAAVCPGERLFAKTLASATRRYPAGEIARAARALADALPTTLHALPDPDAVADGCMALSASASQLPPALQTHVRLEVRPRD